MRLLLVEDDVPTAAFIANSLRARFHEVDIARDGRDAIFMANDRNYEAVILDRRLPLVNGMEVLKRLRNTRQTMPIIMLTASGDMQDKIEGLDAGADDYVVKPVEIDELDARLRAVTRRSLTLGEPGILRAGKIKINLFQKKVTRGEILISLLGLEFSVLSVLVRNAYQVVTRRMLIEEVWGYDFDPSSNIVDAQIARIRTKLNFKPYGNAIITVRGVGYMIGEDA